jgi:uncharacterized protein HemY
MLAMARRLRLTPIPPNFFDDGPGYHAYRYPPTDADEALGPVTQLRTGNEQTKLDALWAFAKKLDDQDDRDAVLEALGKSLLKQSETQKAAGVAQIILAPHRRARLFAALAGAKSGQMRAD